MGFISVTLGSTDAFFMPHFKCLILIVLARCRARISVAENHHYVRRQPAIDAPSDTALERPPYLSNYFRLPDETIHGVRLISEAEKTRCSKLEGRSG